MNFGKGIFIAFILFASFMATLVIVCVKQDVNLVSANYYQEELKHQSKIDKIENATKLTIQPTISFQQGEMSVVYDQFDEMKKGKLILTRPSDPQLDLTFDLKKTEATLQKFTLPKWEQGLYRVSIVWTMDDKEFYVEKIMVL